MTALPDRIARMLQARRLQARWPKPKRFDRNLVVVGAGSAGLVAAYAAAALRAEVTLVEDGAMGGDCLNTGCVPSKALLASARAAHALRHAEAFGLRDVRGTVDFAAVMERVQRVVSAIAPHDSVERFRGLGVDVVRGRARLASPWSVEIDGADGSRRMVTTRAILVATGSRPALPPIPGLAESGCLTSDTVWALRELPRRLTVLGGGPIGCELAQAFARLGAEVTLVEGGPRLLAKEDADVAAPVAEALAADGVRLLVGHRAVRCEGDADTGRRLVVVRNGGDGAGSDNPGDRDDDREHAIGFDALLVAAGRTPRVEDLGLEALGITVGDDGTIDTDACLRTAQPSVFAAGDVAGPFQFTHVASHQAWQATLNALLGGLWSFNADDPALPRVTFTDPEAARLGLSEDEARERGISVEVTRLDLDEIDRVVTDGAARGFVKVLTKPGSDRILGAAVVGEHAGELIAEYTLAMRHGLGLNGIFSTIHAYPTLAESARHLAADWKQAHTAGWMLGAAARFHRWRRG